MTLCVKMKKMKRRTNLVQSFSEMVAEGKKLLKTINEADATPIVATQEKLRENVMTFVSSQLHKIENKENLLAVLEAEIMQKALIHDLTTDDILSAYKTISTEKNQHASTVLELFKPTQVNGNTLIPPPSGDSGESQDVFEKLKPEQRTALYKLYTLLEKEKEKAKEKSIIKEEELE
jgi:hypothetical protein